MARFIFSMKFGTWNTPPSRISGQIWAKKAISSEFRQVGNHFFGQIYHIYDHADANPKFGIISSADGKVEIWAIQGSRVRAPGPAWAFFLHFGTFSLFGEHFYRRKWKFGPCFALTKLFRSKFELFSLKFNIFHRKWGQKNKVMRPTRCIGRITV